MSDEQDKLKVSLEPPKLFGRKKKDAPGPAKRPAAKPAPEEVPEPDPELVEEPVAEPEPEPAEEVAAESAPEPEPELELEPEPEPVAEATVNDDAPAEESVDGTLVIETPAEVEAAPEPEPAPVVEAPVVEAPATKAPAKKAPAKKPAPKKAAPKPVEKAAEEPVAVPAAKKPARPRAKMAPPIEPEPVTTDDHDDAAVAALARDGEPLLALYPAASVTGAVVGGAMVLLTWLSLRGCEAVRDTSSCGGGPGLLLLLATFVVCIMLGSTLLKTFVVPDPGSSSFLAVGLVAVVALLFLIDALDHWSMIIVIPVLSVGAFLASVWVTKTFVEPTET
ncbi:hypothetical protein F0U44_14440 [Nocardioides humilatus]|uniref:Uncharacterized protein n=1 Tax=Nocardioides humilatus TaxID=2607660 RepID=A0A5B1LG35_9ACTN|nr:hypothetical protein [Nocardioides humilatus]KAA1419613.1 hypothetical protein F0U44_14440 [Nocardioides humilatus]